MKAIKILLPLLLVSASARAERYSQTAPDFFLQSASGARALAMGTAQTAAAEGTSALYSNPAQLAVTGRNTVSASYASLFEGASVSEAGFSLSPAGSKAGLAASVAHYSISDAEERDAANNLTGSFGDKRTAVMIGGAYRFFRCLSLGAEGRFLTQSMAGDSSNATAVDAGALLSLGRLSIGAAVQNLAAGDMSREGGSDKLPRIARAGASLMLLEGVLVSADEVNQDPGNTFVVAGAEVRPIPALALRGGYDGTFGTAGVGINVGPLSFDYAMVKQELFGYSHRVSVRFAFGASGGNSGLENKPLTEASISDKSASSAQ